MKIWVRGYLGLRALPADEPCIEIHGEQVTLRDLQNQLGRRGNELPDTRGAAGRLVILLNGRHASHLPDGLDTVLKDGDQVSVFPPVAGG